MYEIIYSELPKNDWKPIFPGMLSELTDMDCIEGVINRGTNIQTEVDRFSFNPAGSATSA